MKVLVKTLLTAASIAVLSCSVQAQEVKSLEQLLEQVKTNRVSEARQNTAREKEFQAARADKQALLNRAQRELKAEQDRGDRLAKQYADNEVTLSEKSIELDLATGTLGEMFGVVRQASSEAFGRISTSIVSAEFPGRDVFLARMSEDSKGLPNIRELEDLWFALQTEMTESGRVSKFKANVISLDGGSAEQEIVRVGTFNLIGEQGYLIYDDANDQIVPLGRQPDSHMVSSAQDLRDANSGFIPVYIDPSRGSILGLLKQKATMMERYHAGGVVGYIITVMLAIGLLIGLYKVITLTLISGKMRAQLNNIDSPSDANPLGRILKVYQANKLSLIHI